MFSFNLARHSLWRGAARKMPAVLCCLAVLLVSGCPNFAGGGSGGSVEPPPSPPKAAQEATYYGVNATESYNLKIIENIIGRSVAGYDGAAGDKYELVVTTLADSESVTSTGTVQAGTVQAGFILEPSKDKNTTFKVEIAADGVSIIFTGVITFDNGVTKGAPGEVITAVVLPAAPAAPTVNWSSDNQLNVTWTGVDNAAAYEVYYGTSNNSDAAAKAGGDVTTTTAAITGFSTANTYYVWVRGKNSAGAAGGFSPAASVTVWDWASVLTGKWDSNSDGYDISATYFIYESTYGDDYGFAGNIKYVSLYDGDEGRKKGVIIIEYDTGGIPGSPYGPAGTTYQGVYFLQEVSTSNDGFKMANTYVASGGAINTLALAKTAYSQAEEPNQVWNWTTNYTQYRQPTPVVDMGVLRGSWKGSSADTTANGWETYMKITDSRFTAYMAGILPSCVDYYGDIVDRTDPSANTGRIYIKVKRLGTLVAGFMDGVININDYYAIAWVKSGNDYKFSVYLDNDQVPNSDLNTVKALPDTAFTESDDEGLFGTSTHVTFTKM